jgi:hypothetical protein
MNPGTRHQIGTEFVERARHGTIPATERTTGEPLRQIGIAYADDVAAKFSTPSALGPSLRIIRQAQSLPGITLLKFTGHGSPGDRPSSGESS